MKNTLLFLAVFLLAGFLFAEEAGSASGIPERKAEQFIKPTWSFGFGNYSMNEGFGSFSEGFTNIGLDVDFVSENGLTLGLQSVMAWNNDIMGTRHLSALGIGYTYNTEKWCLGGKIMSVPVIESGGMGLDINGTYWLNPTFGITGIMDIYFSLGDVDWTIFAMRFGISTKF